MAFPPGFIGAVTQGVTSIPTGMNYESYAAAATTSTADETLTIAKPSGTVPGDTLVAIFEKSSSRAVSLAGWTGITITGDTGEMAALYKTTGGGEPESYIFGLSAGYSYAHGAIVRISGSYSSIVAGQVDDDTYDSNLPFYAPTITANNSLCIWAGGRASEGDTKTLVSISRGTKIYDNTNSNPTAYALWVAAEENVSTGSPIAGAAGTLSASGNAKNGVAICLVP